ncbi:winged helix-turn-helix transcriptional regulator [Oscillospiraceae bacterium CM]|nr:winged helix-turn-helix transcriptional regulator [Oscillospiraceae bacterium CM]
MAHVNQDFGDCRDVLIALGDETRQLIIITLMDIECGQPGKRVLEISKSTHLSRPAVSHHLKILKDAGIIGVHRLGTMNYYFLDPRSKLFLLKQLIAHIEDVFNVQRNG